MADLSYAYANARVKAMKSKLLDRHRMRELMDVRTLSEVIELLEESPYKKNFVKASTKYSGVELAKHALDDNLLASMKIVWNFSPPKAKPVVVILLKQWEVSNLKKAIAAKALGRSLSAEDFIVVVGPFTSNALRKVISIEKIDDLAKALELTEYSSVMRKASSEYSRSHDFRVFLSALDEYYHSVLQRAIKSPGTDYNTKRFLSEKLRFARMLAVLRMKHSGVNPELMRRQLLKEGELGEELDRMVKAESMQTAAEVLAQSPLVDGAEVRRKALENDVDGIEIEAERGLLKLARSTLSRSVLSLGAIAGYLFLKQEEVHSIRKIVYATQFEIKTEIRDTVLAAV